MPPKNATARRAADDALAERIHAEGTEAFLDFWLAQPLFGTLPPDSAGREARLANTPDGLASSLRLAGTGSQEPLWDRLAQLTKRSLPVLLIAGRTRQEVQRRGCADGVGHRPERPCRDRCGAGHACHLEQPQVVSAAISAMADADRRLLVWPGQDGSSEGKPNGEQQPEG